MADTILKTTAISRSFQVGEETIRAVKDVSISIRAGEMVGIVGQSGSGKSTLLHILGTLDRPTSGSLAFDSEDPFLLNDKELSRFRNKRVGFVFQFHHLLSEFTALENVMLPGLISGKTQKTVLKTASGLLDDVGLAHRKEHKPGKMSGGELQRVAIARALVNEPDLVFADEPTGNLDSKTGESIHSLLISLNREKNQTFVIVSHNPDMVARMDRFIRVADGRIVY